MFLGVKISFWGADFNFLQNQKKKFLILLSEAKTHLNQKEKIV